MAKKKARRGNPQKGKVGHKVLLGIFAALLAIPIAVGAAMQQTVVFNNASSGSNGQPYTDLNTASDIKTTTNPDGSMGPVNSTGNYSNTLSTKGTLSFGLASYYGTEPYPSVSYNQPYPSYSYPNPSGYYPQPEGDCPAQIVYYPASQNNDKTKGNKGNQGKQGKNGPQDIKSLCLTISKVEVHIAYLGKPGDQTKPVDRWETLGVANPTVVDLLKENALSMLGVTELAAGRYTQVRLYVIKAEAILINGQKVSLTIPGKNNIVKVNKTFTIEEGKTTTLSLVIDPEHSIIKTGNTYLLKPVVAKIDETH